MRFLSRFAGMLLALCMLSGFHLGTAAHAAGISPAVLAKVASNGRVRVLVAMRDESAQPKRAGLDGRRAAVRESVDGLLKRLPSRGHRLRRRFEFVPAVAMDVDLATLQRLQGEPSVLRVDLDSGGRGHAQPVDTASSLNNVDVLQGLGVDGRGQTVAVIDTGVDTDHVDLAKRLIDEHCFCSIDGAATAGCCPNGTATQGGRGAAEDDHGHGTNVAGIIVGEGERAPRGALPAARLVAVKVIDANNRFCCTSDIVAALDWIASTHPEVGAVNLSLGTDARFAGDCDGSTAFTMSLARAIDVLTERGTAVVVSAGNDCSATSMEAPACVRNALSVAATWDFDGGAIDFLGCSETSTAPYQPTCFSNRSTTTDLYAAGAFVTSAGRNGGTSNYGGTSQAAPMVAACALALRQLAPSSSVAQRAEAMRVSQRQVFDVVSGRLYPFLDCRDAARLFAPASADPQPAQCSGAPVPPHFVDLKPTVPVGSVPIARSRRPSGAVRTTPAARRADPRRR